MSLKKSKADVNPPDTIWTASRVADRPTASLRPYANNNRIHSEKSVRRLRDSVAQFGFVVPIVIDREGVIICGHGRFLAAKDLDLKTVPTVMADHLSAAQVKALRIADNRLAELSDWNEESLRIEFGELMDLSLAGELDFELDVTGFELPEIDIVIGGDGAAGETEPETVEAPDRSASPVTAPGDLWILGGHRILCANALKADSYALLLRGETPRMVFTDPLSTSR